MDPGHAFQKPVKSIDIKAIFLHYYTFYNQNDCAKLFSDKISRKIRGQFLEL